jgi:hypothetical protein
MRQSKTDRQTETSQSNDPPPRLVDEFRATAFFGRACAATSSSSRAAHDTLDLHVDRHQQRWRRFDINLPIELRLQAAEVL